MLIIEAAIAATVLAGLAALMQPRLLGLAAWRAVVTPLASIIGSGFLILGPILHASFGWASPLAMAALCGVAWVFGTAIRHNIATLARRGAWSTQVARRLETASGWALAFAYVVSVAYYLNLFGAFAARGLDGGLGLGGGAQTGRWITTAAILAVLAVGWLRGFGGLERVEQLAVSLKLAIIAGLLLGLAVFAARQVADGKVEVIAPQLTGWPALTLMLGLLITVQGFETSRYLGNHYPAALRIRSMRQAQLISSAIYLVYILLIAYVFAPGQVPLTETGVIDLMRLVAPILPPLLIVAALSAQLSAALADTGGSGGLFAEASGGRISPRGAYAFMAAAGLAMTWALDVFAIVAWASRAFALYYALQSALAAATALHDRAPVRAAAFGALAMLGIAAVLFGSPVE